MKHLSRPTRHRWLVTTTILGLAWMGLRGGPHDIVQATNALQRTQAIAQIANGLCSLAALFLVWRRSPHLRWGFMLRSACFGVAGALAPPAWGDASWIAGLEALILTLIIAAVLGWLSSRAADVKQAPTLRLPSVHPEHQALIHELPHRPPPRSRGAIHGFEHCVPCRFLERRVAAADDSY